MKNPIKVGLWGIGRAGWQMHCPEMERCPGGYQVVACCDILPDRPGMIEKRYPGARGYTDAEKFLNDPEIELVNVATRSPDHIKHAGMALAHGKMVLVEKPLATTLAEAEKLVALDKQYPGKVYVRHNRRFESAFQHVLEIIRSGILGKVYRISLHRDNFSRRDDWQTLTSCGGGQLNNWGPHLIDHALQFLNYDWRLEFAELRLVAACGDAEDHVRFILGNDDLSVEVQISGGVALPGDVYTVYGSRGTLVSHDEKELYMKYLNPAIPLPEIVSSPDSPAIDGTFGNGNVLHWVENRITVSPANAYADNDMFKFLYAAIREGKPFPVKLEEAIEVVRVTDAIKRAVKVRKVGK